MKSLTQIFSAAILLGASASVMALPVSITDITIYDGDSSAPTGWEGQQEDNEVEPGMVANDSWDLEGFFKDTNNPNQIGIVASYDFYNTNLGLDGRPGDIFIDINGDHILGNASNGSGPNGNQNVANSFGYDYVLDIDWSANTYSLLQLSTSSIVQTALFGQNYGSSPWQYISGAVGTLSSGSFTANSGLTNAQTGKTSGNGLHNAVYGFDLSALGNTTFTSHFTTACGNDNLLGSSGTSVVPVPAAVWLFGSALGLMGLVRRRVRA